MPFGGDMNARQVKWAQPCLVEGGYPLLTMTYVVHVDGPNGTCVAGWTIETTDTGSWVAAEVSQTPCNSSNHAAVIGGVADTLKRLEGFLSPF
jgi:hypothetical protein